MLLLSVGDGCHGQTGTVSIEIRKRLTSVNKRPFKKRRRIYQYGPLTGRLWWLDASLRSRSQGGMAQSDGVLVRILASPGMGRCHQHLFRSLGAFAIGW
jgi:hypothetical protein